MAGRVVGHPDWVGQGVHPVQVSVREGKATYCPLN